MKRILLIATGGTIACKQTASGLAPQLGAKELLSYVRDRAENVESIELFRMDSSNVQPEEWRAIAQAVADNMHKADGIVITHAQGNKNPRCAHRRALPDGHGRKRRRS